MIFLWQRKKTETPAVKVSESPAVMTAEPSVVSEKAEVPAPVTESKISDIHNLVISTISETTGFPGDMIKADMELESDLGVDSIQKVEIFSAINEKLGNVFSQDSMATLQNYLKFQK